MSGALSAISTAVSALFGAAGAVTLGEVTFQGFEVPERITFGGTQQMTVHRLPGGQRVIDLMGRDDRTLEWSGTFLSADAADRARELDDMRIAGQAVTLAYGDQFVPSVLIASFEADYQRPNWIPYRVSCVVLDPGDGQATGQASPLTQVTDDLGSAIAIDLPATLAGVSGALTVAQTAAGAMTTLAGGAPATLGLLSALNQAQTATGGALTLANGNLSGLTALAPAGGILGSVAALPAALDAAQSSAGLAVVQGFVGRATFITGGAG